MSHHLHILYFHFFQFCGYVQPTVNTFESHFVLFKTSYIYVLFVLYLCLYSVCAKKTTKTTQLISCLCPSVCMGCTMMHRTIIYMYTYNTQTLIISSMQTIKQTHNKSKNKNTLFLPFVFVQNLDSWQRLNSYCS